MKTQFVSGKVQFSADFSVSTINPVTLEYKRYGHCYSSEISYGGSVQLPVQLGVLFQLWKRVLSGEV